MDGSEANSETPQFAKVPRTLQFGFPDLTCKASKFQAGCIFLPEIDGGSHDQK